MVKSASVGSFQSFLRAHGLMFACAESCTGGLLSREMTALPGSSEVFWGGIVSYADQAKVRLLGVDAGLLSAHGAVSGEVAHAMAQGVLEVSHVPLAVGITGVAGPGGGSEEKPVGTVWFGLGSVRDSRAGVVAVRHRFDGTRSAVQRQSAQWARILAQVWWEAAMDLDSLRSLTDNHSKPFVEASDPPLFFPFGPL